MRKLFQKFMTLIRNASSSAQHEFRSQFGVSDQDEVEPTRRAVREKAMAAAFNYSEKKFARAFERKETEYVAAESLLENREREREHHVLGAYMAFRRKKDPTKLQWLLSREDARLRVVGLIMKDPQLTGEDLRTMTAKMGEGERRDFLGDLLIGHIDKAGTGFLSALIDAGADVHARGDKALLSAVRAEKDSLAKARMLYAKGASFENAYVQVMNEYRDMAPFQQRLLSELHLFYKIIVKGESPVHRLLEAPIPDSVMNRQFAISAPREGAEPTAAEADTEPASAEITLESDIVPVASLPLPPPAPGGRK